MKTKLLFRLFFVACLLTIVVGAFPRPATADTIFLPFIVKPQSGCQFSTLLQNGSFENGVAPWVQSSASNLSIIQPKSFAYEGTKLAWFGGYNNGNDRLFQTFSVPQGCTSLKIVLYLRSYTTDSLTYPYDKLYGSLQPVNSISNPEVLIASNVKNCDCVWRRMTYIYPQIPNPGQPLRLYLHATSDSSLYTNFYVDLVSVEASAASFAPPSTAIQLAGDESASYWIEPVEGGLPLLEEANAKQNEVK
jgi:hypothetical protein